MSSNQPGCAAQFCPSCKERVGCPCPRKFHHLRERLCWVCILPLTPEEKIDKAVRLITSGWMNDMPPLRILDAAKLLNELRTTLTSKEPVQ